MALPYLIKHVYSTGTEEVIRRGKKIYSAQNVQLAGEDDLLNSLSFRVKDDTYNIYYKVTIQKYDDPKEISARCSCPYNLTELCRHEAAAMLQLQDLVDKNLLTNTPQKLHNQKHTVVQMKFIDLNLIRTLTGVTNYPAAEEFLRKNKCNILHAANERVEADLDMADQTYKVILQRNEDRNFDTSCNCNEQQHLLCKHKTALFLQLLNNWGPYYFDSILNRDRQKNKLLERYGYQLTDDLTGKFEFVQKDGKLILRVLDPSLTKVNQPAKPVSAVPVSNSTTDTLPAPPKPVATEKTATRKAPYLLMDTREPLFPYLRFGIVMLSGKTGSGSIDTLDLGRFIYIDNLQEDEKHLLQAVKKIQEPEIKKYLNRNSPFSGFWENIVHTENNQYPEETKLLIAEFLYPKLRRLFENFADRPAYALLKGVKPAEENLETISLQTEKPKFEFKISPADGGWQMEAWILVHGRKMRLQDNEWSSPLLYLNRGDVYMWESFEEALLAAKFSKTLSIPHEEWPTLLRELVLPLSETHKIEFAPKLIREVKEGTPTASVKLIEKGDYLLFQPTFTYKNFAVKPQDKDVIVIAENDKVLLVHRNREAENEFVSMIRNLHSQFSYQPQMQSLMLKGADVLKNNWFFLFMDAMNERKIPVFGFEALKNFKFNTARPSTKISVSSGVDWFDANVEVTFGNQQIGVGEIQKALSNRQSFIQLNDGTLGILPEEWLKKYALLFKVGEGKDKRLRLSKYHLSVIDELYEQRDEAELQFKLDEKFERLKEFDQLPDVPVPNVLSNRLRPYQIAGFQWLYYLYKVGWGGILADDMGLGKTVQSIAMLQKYYEENGHLTALVVCPTTLIYNWENELRKFSENLTYVIHHGNSRSRNREELKRHHIIITTYGTLRSDVHLLMKVPFDYAVLDESQAIKNPFSKVTRAAGLLHAKHKVCMSGTPLQNNTFDLYAQTNFLNPGLLGSVEFFRNEFATPIDKLGEPEQKEHLRKLLYPFILRRTKEQVAKDLPEKTETILFCEMNKKQRSIYDYYRSMYRSKILGIMEDAGVGKSQFTILQGLMKLRQICDSPAILNEDEKYPNESIKLEELTREVTENIGEHKTLIFSQFLGMLGLIRERFEQLNIPYEYFDGSTTPQERERAIQNFQNDEDCRVFLISLKAGGVGLNLTAADYVYIVDPWWNPAVEQQAIDRTHRIGQTKNIFAYRMICKDTIEDKILTLQERKKELARDLISDDQGFVKSLTKEDVEYLFS